MHSEPQKEHHWLQKMVGEWSYESECLMGPGQPPMKSQGVEVVRSLGGLWVLCEGTANMPGGGEMKSIITLGYDPAQKRYVGTFIASVMNRMWLYGGQLNPAETILTLDTEGPSFTDPNKTCPYQDIFEWVDENHRILASQVRGDDGVWVRFMTGHYRRVK